jgi:Rieske 2Fe-2S family protein
MTNVPPETRARNATPTRVLTRTHGLPGRWFSDPQVHQREGERIFRSHWLCVAHAAAASKPGDYLTLELEGQPLLLIRGGDGVLRGFYNVCRHRAALLVESPSGSLRGALRCPYHGWSYDARGQLVATPHMSGTPGFCQADYPLQPVATEVWNGLVFVNLVGEAPPLRHYLAPLWNTFDAWNLATWRPGWEQSYRVAANWKLLLENFHECYHCPGVHPQLNALSPFQSAENDLTRGPILGGPMRLSEGVQTLSLGGRLCGVVPPTLSEMQRRQVSYYGIFPNLLFSPHPDYVLVHYLHRLGMAETAVHCLLLFAPEALDQPGFDPTPAGEFWHQTNLQDWEMCERVQRGITSLGYEPGPYSVLESTVAAIDEHYLQVMGETE